MDFGCCAWGVLCGDSVRCACWRTVPTPQGPGNDFTRNEKAPEGPVCSAAVEPGLSRACGTPVRVSISILSSCATVGASHSARQQSWQASGGRRLAGRFCPGDDAFDAGGAVPRNGLAVIEHHFNSHAVFQVVQGIAHVFLPLRLVVPSSMHTYMGSAKCGVGAFLLVQNDLVSCHVGFDHFGAEVGDQALRLRPRSGRLRPPRFRIRDDRVFAHCMITLPARIS